MVQHKPIAVEAGLGHMGILGIDGAKVCSLLHAILRSHPLDVPPHHAMELLLQAGISPR
jgi:hypothetical protein